MCRNTSEDRKTLIAALKRIARPPENIQGQTGMSNAGLNEFNYHQHIVNWMQDIAEATLEKIGVDIT